MVKAKKEMVFNPTNKDNYSLEDFEKEHKAASTQHYRRKLEGLLLNQYPDLYLKWKCLKQNNRKQHVKAIYGDKYKYRE
jgi:hypothetical protein